MYWNRVTRKTVSGANDRSLSARLSRWLALQTLLGLAIVATLVYVGTATNLRARQSIALGQKEESVRHVLDEASRDRDVDNLLHKLDDHLIVHKELSLSLTSEDGQVLYRSPGYTERDFGTAIHKSDFEARDPDGKPIRAQLILSTRDDDRLLSTLGWTLLATALLTAVSVSAGSFYLVRAGLKPVQDLIEQTGRISAAGLGARLDGSAQPQELRPLVEQFNALLIRLEAAWQQLEGFNADVAHELHTPMTNLITNSELALRGPAGIDALREGLASNLEEAQRLAGIVNDMLFLSRADRGANARRVEIASLAALASDVIEYHEAAILEAELTVDLQGDAEGAFDVPLIKRALSNLLGNATRYADRGSTLIIAIERHAADRVRLSVTNQGPCIEARHLGRLFDRFYRADASRQHSDTHHGLGLAIVAAIARMHGGAPGVESADGQTTVRLDLRATQA